MGQAHAKQIEIIENLQIVIVVEPNPSNFALAKTIFSATTPILFSDLDSALKSERVDGWIISSPTRTHLEVANRLLSDGYKVLLEKPIAITRAEAEELRKFVLADSSNLMLGHILLWNPEFQAFQREVSRRGKIKTIHCSRQRSASHRIDYSGESLFSLLMVHDLYCVQSLMNGSEPLSLIGQTESHPAGGDHFAAAQLGWADSTLALLEANYFLPDTSNGLLVDEISVSGDSWHLKMIYGTGYITVLEDSRLQRIDTGLEVLENAQPNYDEALRNELIHFGEILASTNTVPFGAQYESACQVAGWTDALIASANNRKGL